MAEVVTQTSEPITEGGLFKPPGGGGGGGGSPTAVEPGEGDGRSALVLRVFLPVTEGVAHATPVESEQLAIELAQRRFGKGGAAKWWRVLPFELVLPVGVLAPGGEA